MAQGDMRVYDPDQYSVNVAGVPVSGYAEDEFLTIERESDDFEDVVGVDGEVTRSKIADDRATAVVRLMQSSPSNDLLSALLTSDKNTPGGVGVGPFLVRDKQGTSIFLAEKCWISRAPNVSLGRTAREREWTFRLAKLVPVHGSN